MSFFDQMVFEGVVDCKSFIPHFAKADQCCECMKKMDRHARESVADEEMVRAAMEYSQKGRAKASVVLEGKHQLLLGGWLSAVRAPDTVSHILCCAVGLEMFGPRYSNSVEEKTKQGVKYLMLEWWDTLAQAVPDEDIEQAVRFIHTGLEKSDVLVHCAAGKSRSTTCVVAYLLCVLPLAEAAAASGDLDVDKVLAFVKKGRAMAQPNEAFMKQLKVWARTKAPALRAELLSSSS